MTNTLKIILALFVSFMILILIAIHRQEIDNQEDVIIELESGKKVVNIGVQTENGGTYTNITTRAMRKDERPETYTIIRYYNKEKLDYKNIIVIEK